jgi:carbonic anhydrase
MDQENKSWISGIFENNKAWVQTKLETNPNYFKNLAKGQNPKALFIGCADSRVRANEVTGTEPGELFVHRNNANMVVHTDINMLSVLQYAVEVLKVEHVIVCGHYGCGGVAAAMGDKQFGMIDNWLRNIMDVIRLHYDVLKAIKNEKEKANKLVELNVKEQVFNLSKTSIIQNAWNNGQILELHGLVYDLGEGLLRSVDIRSNSSAKMDDIYQFEAEE